MQEVLYSPGHQATWHHYLHGDQSDEAVGWLCRPERRPILVNSDHLRHLQELLEVYAGVTISDRPALSVANLSQSDPNLQAGQGALCVAIHLRVPAEEGSPPRVGHGLLTVKRQLQPAALGDTLRTLSKLAGALAPAGERGLEDAYLRFLVAEAPSEARAAWLDYLGAFDAALPVAPISDPEHEWIPQIDARMPERIAVLGKGPDDHGRILEVMAGLASVLYQSSVRWGELTTSRRVPADREGLVVQLLAEGEPAALVERSVPLAELEGEVEDWITKLLPLRRARIESASPFTDQSWSTSRRREVVNVPEINRPKPQRERLELPRERVELPSTPTPEPRQRPRSAVDAVELPLRAPDPPRPVAAPPPPPQVQRAVSLDPPVPLAPLPVSLPPPPTLPPTNPDELHEPMPVRTPWDSALSLPFTPPPSVASDGPMVRSPNPRPMPPPVADFFGGGGAPPVDDEQIFAGDEDVSEEVSSPSEPGIPSEPGLLPEAFEAPAPPPPPPAPPPPPPAPPRPQATWQDFIDEGQRPNVAPVDVPRSSGKGRRRPTVDESAPTPLSKQRSDTILAIGLDEDAPLPRSRPVPPPQRALDQNEESLEGPALLEAPLNRRSDSPVEAREVDPPTVAPQDGPPLPPPMPSKVERRPQSQAFVAPPLIPTSRPAAAEPDEASRSKAEVVKLPPKGQGRRKAEPTPVELSAEDYTPVAAEAPPPVVAAPVPPAPRAGGNNRVRVAIAVLAGVALAFFLVWITGPTKGTPRPQPPPVIPVEAARPPVEPPPVEPPPVEAPPVEAPPVEDPGGEALPEVALEAPPPGVNPGAVTQPPVAAVQATDTTPIKTPDTPPEKSTRPPKNTTPKAPPPPVEPPPAVVVIAPPPVEPPPPSAGAVKLSLSGAGADRVERVLLVKGGQRWDLKSGPVVPVGSYPVTVFFKGQSDTSGAGVIQVSGDTTVSLRCAAPEGGESATPDCSASASRD